ncbi:MAG: hypothetical protein WAU02_03620 [Candidatus Saccharimonadales bacterium]
MNDYKTYISLVAVIVAFISYIPYFKNIFSGKTKPHAFSWLIWSILNAIAFAGQLYDSGGVGAWAVGFTAIALITIFLLALRYGEKDIKPFDWYCLAGAGASLILWAFAKDPLGSVILITLIDALGFLPTVRKAYRRPHQETLVTFVLSTIKYFLVLVALQHYSVVTVLFPLSLVIMNGLFVIMLVFRRKKVGHH